MDLLAPIGPVGTMGASKPLYTEMGLVMDGLHAHRHNEEVLIGKDIAPAEAARYRSDAWAKDECGDRVGTIIKVQKNDISGGMSCVVRWDRIDGRPWGKDPDRNLSKAYCGLYSCGSRGHFHLALDAVQPIPEIVKTTSKATSQDADAQTVSVNFWEDEKHIIALQEIEAISSRSRVLQRELEALKERTNDQLQLFTEMCENHLDEAENLLDKSSTSISDEDLGLKKEDSKKKKGEETDDIFSKEQKALESEVNHLWAAVEAAQNAYKKKLQADEMASKLMDQLQEILLPPFFIYCAAEITEMARKFTKFALAGTTDHDGRALPSELQKAGILDRRQISTLSWVTPVKHLVPDSQKASEVREQSLEQIRKEFMDIAAQLQSMKIRPESNTLNLKEQGNAHEQGQLQSILPRPEFFHALLESKTAEQLIARIEELSKAPEAIYVKKEVDNVAKCLKQLLPVFGKVHAWETSSDDPKSHTDEGRRERKALRNSLTEEILRVCAKMKSGSEEQKPVKKDDSKSSSKPTDAKKDAKGKGKDSKEKPVDNSSQTDRRRGPEYDIDDVFGGALLGDELECEMARVRQALQAMLLRKKELDIARLEEARRKKMPSMQESGTQTEPAVFLGSHIRHKVAEFLGIEIKDEADFGRMREQAYYGGRITLTDPFVLPKAMEDGLLRLDLAGAQAALISAQRAYRLVDTLLVKDQLLAAGEADDRLSDAEREQRARAAALGARAARLAQYLARLEERGLRLAQGLLELGRVQLLGGLRGEYLGDSGGAHNATALARRAYDGLLECGRLRAEEERARRQEEAAAQAARARALGARLVAEAEGLLRGAGRELEEQRPVDALLSVRSAEAKLARAVITEPGTSPPPM